MTCVYARHDIAQITAPEILDVRSRERLALSITPSRVRHQHEITCLRQRDQLRGAAFAEE